MKHLSSKFSFILCPHYNRITAKAINNLFINPFLSSPVSVFYYHKKTNSLYHQIPENLKDSPYIYKVKIANGSPYTPDPDTSQIPWRETFGGRRRSLRWLRTPEDYVSAYFSDCCVDPTPYLRLLDYSLSQVLPLFKKIKIWCHHHFTTFGSSVRYFIDLDALSGVPPPSIRTLGDDPNRWLTQLVSSQYGRSWWSEQFKQTFGQFSVKLPDKILSIKDFAASPWLWVTDGSSKFSRLELDNQLIKTKFGVAASLTPSEIWSHVLKATSKIPDSEQIQVFVKPDEASFKRRLIANVPLGGYIIAAYVRYLLESYLGKEPQFMKLNVQPMDTIDIVSLLRQGRLAMPLDESAYDYHVTRSSWLGFFDFLNQVFPNNLGVAYFKYYFDHAFWIYENQRGRWLKGMPSGLALTTYLNSWMNFIKQKTVVDSEIHWACGDDVLTFPLRHMTLEEVEQQYLRFGSEANASKNWVSNRFCEYLKVIYGVTGTSGYPARIFGSLLFSVHPNPPTPVEQLYEITDLYKQYYDRLGLKMREDLLVKDLTQAVSNKVRGFNRVIALKWLHSPKIHGGYGKLPYNNSTFTWVYEQYHYYEYKKARIRLPRVVKPITNPQLVVGTYKLNLNCEYRFGPPKVLPQITTEEEWVARLNREDMPKGPFSELSLDQIPLPVMDFVSVANTSKLASYWSFNCAPNLHGSWNTISSRLVKGSLLLAQNITTYLRTHDLTTLI